MPGDHQFADQDFFLAAGFQFAGERNAEQVRDDRSVQRGEQGGRHTDTDLARIVERSQHLHQADKGTDHAECRRGGRGGIDDLLAVLMTLFDVGDLDLEDRRQLFLRAASNHHLQSTAEEVVVDVLELVLQGEQPVATDDRREVHELLDDLRRRRKGDREALLDHRGNSQHLGQREVDQQCRERSADGDHQRGHVDERTESAPSDEDRTDHQGEPEKESDDCCNVHDRRCPERFTSL